MMRFRFCGANSLFVHAVLDFEHPKTSKEKARYGRSGPSCTEDWHAGIEFYGSRGKIYFVYL